MQARADDFGELLVSLDETGGGAMDHSVSLRLREEDDGFVADGDVGPAIPLQGPHVQLRADAGIVVDQVRDVVGARLVAHQAEPIEHGRGVRLGIALRAVRPETLAGDDILEAVAVDVGEDKGVRLGELSDVSPMAFPQAQPSMPLPLTAAGDGIKVRLKGWSTAGNVVVNFLWDSRMRATVAGAARNSPRRCTWVSERAFSHSATVQSSAESPPPQITRSRP